MTTPEKIAEQAAEDEARGEVENVGLAFNAAALTVRRLREAGWIRDEPRG